MKLSFPLPAHAGRKRALILMLLDVLSILFAYGFALLLRFDFAYSHIVADSEYHIIHYINCMPIWCLVRWWSLFCSGCTTASGARPVWQSWSPSCLPIWCCCPAMR